MGTQFIRLRSIERAEQDVALGTTDILKAKTQFRAYAAVADQFQEDFKAQLPLSRPDHEQVIRQCTAFLMRYGLPLDLSREFATDVARRAALPAW